MVQSPQIQWVWPESERNRSWRVLQTAQNCTHDDPQRPIQDNYNTNNEYVCACMHVCLKRSVYRLCMYM